MDAYVLVPADRIRAASQAEPVRLYEAHPMVSRSVVPCQRVNQHAQCRVSGSHSYCRGSRGAYMQIAVMDDIQASISPYPSQSSQPCTPPCMPPCTYPDQGLNRIQTFASLVAARTLLIRQTLNNNGTSLHL